MAQKIDSIIFDLDGTLVDSQPAALGATVEALSRFGVQATDAEVREQFGGGARKILRYFLERDLDPDEAEEVIDEITALRNELQLSYTDRVILLPEVERLLKSLKTNRYKLAIATMSARNIAMEVTTFHGISDCFDAMLTADDVVKVKPDPEILIMTIGRLGGQVDRTLYVGDSSHDLEAAVSLGIPFLLADTGIYVRGETREKLRAAAKGKGFPIVGLTELSDISDIAMSMVDGDG